MRKVENIQKEELKILCQFRDYCNNHGLRYYLEGGTLIGAIRHKGFIPWDDDIDTIMPRQDYERLIQLVKEEPIGDDLEVITRDSGKKFRYPYAKICNERTIIAENGKKEENGIFIDVFPIDGASNKPKNISIRYKYMDMLKVLENYAWMTEEDVKSLSKHKKLRWKICRKIGAEFFRKVLDKIFLKYKCGSTKYVSQICWSTIMVNDETSSYLKQIQVEFEGESFMAPSCYHERLTSMYGNYMQLPPEKERNAKHSIEAWWKE